jgi:hypothetical protein
VLTYTYANEPEQQYRPRSQPHAGASQFNMAGRSPTRMTGTYWTARLTVGDMSLHLLNRKTDYATLADVTAASTTNE